MKVLHDYDNRHLSGNYAFRRGTKLILYAIFKRLGIKSKITEDLDAESDEYLETIIKQDLISGVTPIIGLRDIVLKENPRLKDLVENYGVELHEHIHMGARGDLDRKRLWDPPLTQSMKTWHYDVDWVAGKAEKLDPEEYPVWHIDYPYLNHNYVDFLYAWRFGGFDPYAESS